MTEAMTAFSTVGAGLLDFAGDAVEFVTDNPICLIGVGCMLVVTAVGLARSLIRGV